MPNVLDDPAFNDIPVSRLLSREYAKKQSARIRLAVEQKWKLQIERAPRRQGGTVHLSAADREGNLVALTLTHGADFGAHVTVDSLGILLSAGMGRFAPDPNHPNSPGPGKRPLHNMCPTIVLKGDQPVLAVRGAGGRRIPNAVLAVLSNWVGQGVAVTEAVAGGRVYTEGGDEVWFDGPVIPEAGT